MSLLGLGALRPKQTAGFFRVQGPAFSEGHHVATGYLTGWKLRTASLGSHRHKHKRGTGAIWLRWSSAGLGHGLLGKHGGHVSPLLHRGVHEI